MCATAPIRSARLGCSPTSSVGWALNPQHPLTLNSADHLVQRAANGNPEAAAFLVAWHRYCHLLDDIVDGDVPPFQSLQLARWANDLYSSPFYRAHQLALQPLIQLITCTYEDSVEMERGEPWAKSVADVIRHTGSDMVRMVAWLTGGYEAMRDVSQPLRRLCYFEHHDAAGNPI